MDSEPGVDGDSYVEYSRQEELSSAGRALDALSQETRLAAFRLLVGAGKDGIAAGNIARVLSVPHNTLSSHLAILVNAGLAGSRREGRSIIYRVDLEGTRARCCRFWSRIAARAVRRTAPRRSKPCFPLVALEINA